MQSTNGGVGNDWAHFGTFPNSNTGLTPFQAQGQAYNLGVTPSSTLRITGYGTDSTPPTRNQTQQTNAGPYVPLGGTALGYTIDTTGGNSGSPVIATGGVAVGIHTHGGCGNVGNNHGTSLSHSALQAAINNPRGVCDCNDPPVAAAGGDVGAVAGQPVSFNGSNSYDPNGDPIVSFHWNFGDGSTASGINTSHTYSSAGTYTVTLTVSDGSAQGVDSLIAHVMADGGSTMFVTLRGSGNIPGVGPIAKEDIYLYPPRHRHVEPLARHERCRHQLREHRRPGPPGQRSGDHELCHTPTTVPGLSGGPNGNQVDDSDLVLFAPTSTGTNTSGSFTFYFDGSDVGLTTADEDIDGISLRNNGNLLISTRGPTTYNGLSNTVRDEDLVRFVLSSTGSHTSGGAHLWFDGSDVGLGGQISEDVIAVHARANGNRLFLSFRGQWSASGITGANEDVGRVILSSHGANTSGSWSMFLNGTAFGLPATANITGFHMQ